MLKFLDGLEPMSSPPRHGAPSRKSLQFAFGTAARRRYWRGSAWAARSGAGEPDFAKLGAMRSLERRNRG